MEKFTRDFIYALKGRSDDTYQERAIHFLSEYTVTPKDHYTRGILYRIARQKFLDYLSTADYPHADVRNYFEILDRHDCISETDALLIALSTVQVRGKNGEYVNGFWEDLCE